MEDWPMRNLYNCGCYVADDVPVISRCAQHNGWVVARVSHQVTRPRQLTYGDKLKIIHHNLYDVLPNLKKPFDFVLAYPEYNLFSAQQQLTAEGFIRSRMELFDHIQRLLKPDSKAVIIVDVCNMASAVYQALLRGFEVHTRFAPVLIKSEPLYGDVWDERVYKAVIGLNTGPLPRFRLGDATSFFDALEVPDDARILDTSCILLDVLQSARPNAKVVGIIEDGNRYKRTLAAVEMGTDNSTDSDPSSNRSVRKKGKRRPRSV